MLITIRHRLSLPASPGHAHTVQHLLLTPRSLAGQNVIDWRIDMPGIAGARKITDGFGNLALLVTQTRHEGEIDIVVAGEVETHDGTGVVGRLPGDTNPALFLRPTALTRPDLELIAEIAPDEDRVALLHGLMQRVGDRAGVEVAGAAVQGQSGSQSQADGGQSQQQETGGQAAGTTAIAAELSHAFIGACKALGIPARYVSGYVLATDEHPAAFHGWAEAYTDRLGWIGFDCQLGVCPTDRHVRVAMGLDGNDARPVRAWPMLGEAREAELTVAETAQ